jgi:hypothetical protein
MNIRENKLIIRELKMEERNWLSDYSGVVE